MGMGSRDADSAQLQELFEPEKSVKKPVSSSWGPCNSRCSYSRLSQFQEWELSVESKIDESSCCHARCYCGTDAWYCCLLWKILRLYTYVYQALLESLELSICEAKLFVYM